MLKLPKDCQDWKSASSDCNELSNSSIRYSKLFILTIWKTKSLS